MGQSRRIRARERVLGSILGASIGDALGGPLELSGAAEIRRVLGGSDWIEDLLPYPKRATPHGIWQDRAPAGTGTDDTRYNHVFLEIAVAHEGCVTPEILASAYIDRFEYPEMFYPDHPDLAREQFRPWQAMCAARLRLRSTAYPGIPAEVLASNCTWGGFPVITGLLTLAPAGMLWPAAPERAYREAFHLAFWDLGYARDATALMAAIISACFDERRSPVDILRSIPAINPYASVMDGFTGRQMTQHLPTLMAIAETSLDDRELMTRLAHACAPFHVFDPIDVLNVPIALLSYTQDPAHALLLAANHRKVDAEGNLVQTRDTDCVGFVTGALAGAMYGIDAFPQAWREAVLQANQRVYGFDLLQNAEAFCHAIRIT